MKECGSENWENKREGEEEWVFYYFDYFIFRTKSCAVIL